MFATRKAPTLAHVVGSTLLLAACATGEATEAGQVLQIQTVGRASIISSVEATGTIEPIRIIEVKSQAGGEVLSLPVELGDKVERGTLLVRIDPRDVNNAFAQAEADLEVAQARFGVAERQLGRIQELRDADIVTTDELEAAILESANAKAALVRATTNLELAEDKLNDVTLRAPITGTIVERTLEEGQVVTGTRDLTGGTVLMRMADLTEVQVRTLVDETDIGRLKAGLPAEIKVEAYPDRTFRGSVLKIEPQAVVEQNVTMFAVLTRIANEEDLLRPGMNSDVVVVIGRQDNVLALANSGIKVQQEASQLVNALGLNIDVNEIARAASTAGREPTESAGGEEEALINGRRPSEIQSMSDSERREWFQGLSAAERQQMTQQFRGGGGAGGQQQANSGQPRQAFVFYYDATGALAVKAIMIGLSDFDNTQVVSGLEEGDEVVAIPFSIIQQQEFLNRIRGRSSLPGVGGGR